MGIINKMWISLGIIMGIIMQFFYSQKKCLFMGFASNELTQKAHEMIKINQARKGHILCNMYKNSAKV